MHAPATGEFAANLPWLFPSATSLVTLARSPFAASWPQLRCDPGLVILLMRFGPPSDPSTPLNIPQILHDPSILEASLGIFESPVSCFVDWREPRAAPAFQFAVDCAYQASALAAMTGLSDPERAWITGLLTPLAGLAQAVVLHSEQSETAKNACEASRERPAIDHCTIVRRLCRRWQLPGWLTSIIGRLDLEPEGAITLGADASLFRITQLAAALANQKCQTPFVVIGGKPESNALALGLAAAPTENENYAQKNAVTDARIDWTCPTRVPLLKDVLVLAAEKRRLAESSFTSCLESETDQLHVALREQHRSESSRLQQMKLRSLAEFAAGAGHEINNPLAVISGQAQYLLIHEPDPSRQKSLQKIIGQTQRIHGILQDLMQYSRPPIPNKHPVDPLSIVRKAAAEVEELSIERRVQVRVADGGIVPLIEVDARQIGAAVACLLRNAVEAAPAEGWVSVHLEHDESLVSFVIEDNGPGPNAAHRELIFDPFFSGRAAGRGRGLGLPTAWQFARTHGGDVFLADSPAGVTRFILQLPIRASSAGNNSARNERPTNNGEQSNGHSEDCCWDSRPRASLAS